MELKLVVHPVLVVLAHVLRVQLRLEVPQPRECLILTRFGVLRQVQELLTLYGQGGQLSLHLQVALVKQGAHSGLLEGQQVCPQQLVLLSRLLEGLRLHRGQIGWLVEGGLVP